MKKKKTTIEITDDRVYRRFKSKLARRNTTLKEWFDNKVIEYLEEK